MYLKRVALFALLSVFSLAAFARPSFAQTQQTNPVEERLRALQDSLTFLEQRLAKDIDDLMWFRLLDDIADIDKVRYTGPPPRVIPNPTGQGAGNPVIITAYTFMPKSLS
ncbi:MAG: hypothetical protein AB1631_21145 [Acidobacteriota bacterium]